MEYCPSLHATFWVGSDAFGQAKPAGHGLQLVEPAGLWCPETRPCKIVNNYEICALLCSKNIASYAFAQVNSLITDDIPEGHSCGAAVVNSQ